MDRYIHIFIYSLFYSPTLLILGHLDSAFHNTSQKAPQKNVETTQRRMSHRALSKEFFLLVRRISKWPMRLGHQPTSNRPPLLLRLDGTL
jgi:hypothetical protein